MEVKLPFYPITPKSVIADELFAFALSTGAWQPYYNFSAVQVPFELAFSDPVLAGIGAKHSLAVGIVRLDPYTTYDWHTDTKRGVSINMLLNDVKSHCLFEVGHDEATHTFLELKYAPKSYYLFNNQVPHMVTNFAQSRYLMSVEFVEGKDELTFDQLLEEVK
jgi:hypothetical protein